MTGTVGSALERMIRSAIDAALVLAAAAAILFGGPSSAGSAPSRGFVAARSIIALDPPVDSVRSVGLTVADLERNIEFFTGVLEFRLVAVDERHGPEVERTTGVFGARIREATLALGDEQLRLTQFIAPEGRPIPIDSRSNDCWFQHAAIVVSDIDLAYAHLRRCNVRHASPAPQTLPESIPAAAGISAFYFKAPEGHVLEIIRFPEGKGDPRWQGRADSLFLGIDHTAIVVRDTERAMGFYRDLLGMQVVGQSENHGPEQARLNNVEAARLRITTLRAQHGPGVELLEYLSPRNGRDTPADAVPNDALAWTTRLSAADAAGLLVAMEAAGTPVVSRGCRADGRVSPFLVRDPDRHLVLLEPACAPGRERP
ncbi:MAG: VOC family protein [Phycisphaeraceae bacterium]|nr:VOC family protein [Phycisphaeraceae bacterium]